MNIIDWILYIPLVFCVCYLLLYAIASKFYRAPQYPEARTLRTHRRALSRLQGRTALLLLPYRAFLER